MSSTLVYRRGDRGQIVADLQTVLGLQADGIFGEQTYNAVRTFQQANSLVIDGIAGERTLTAAGVYPVAGIDVSHHNGAIDWKAVAASGVRFAYIKATEGQTWFDQQCRTNIAAAREQGIKVGVYHFATPSATAQDAEGEAMHLWQMASTLGRLDLPPVLDIESNPNGLTQAQMSAWVSRWSATTAVKWGRRPIVYTFSAFLGALGTGEWTNVLPLWLARYTNDNDPGRTAPWSKWTIWQHSTEPGVPGTTGRIDRNWLAGGTAGLCALCALK
jgi:lysozyme